MDAFISSDAMDPTLRWLLIGSVFSVGTFFLWFVWGRFTRSIHGCLFQFLSEKFNLSEHRFSNVSNLVAITKILNLMGLGTNRYLWQHDANAATGDAMMVGYIRLPTRSWLRWSVAILGISHYIWISDDASEITIVGPSGSVDALLRVSNLSAHREATDAELERVRMAFEFCLMPQSRESGSACVWRA